MVSYVENYDPSDSAALQEAYGYAAGLSACVLVWAVLHHLYFYHMQRVGMRLRVAVCRMIYRKVSVVRYHGVFLSRGIRNIWGKFSVNYKFCNWDPLHLPREACFCIKPSLLLSKQTLPIHNEKFPFEIKCGPSFTTFSHRLSQNNH